ncbi:sensor histidine kinase, partial [Pontibacter sp. HJ8]
NVVEKLETREAVSAVASGMATLQHAPDDARLPVDSLLVAIPVGAEKSRTAIPRSTKKAEASRQKTATPPAGPDTKPSRHNLGIASSHDQPRTLRGKVGNNHTTSRYSSGDSALWARSFTGIPRGIPVLAPLQLERIVQGYATADSLRAASLKRNPTYRVEHLPDSTITYFQQVNGRHFRISVDTLQYIALHLDSIWRHKKPDFNIRAEEIAALHVLRDSLIVLKNATASRLQAQRMAALEMPGRVVLRHPPRAPQETQSLLTEASPRALVDAYEKQPPVPAIPARPAAVPDPVKVEAKKEKLNDVVEKMVVEYVAKDVPLQERLNLANLKPMLQAELTNKGICLDFGYWVLSGRQDTVAAGHIVAASDSFATYKANLFPNDIFDKPDYLAVYFPDSHTYALQSLWVMLLFSAAFTLVIVATFGTTIHIIFKQKKLSEMKNDFINNMTHEFKTPIATISLATDSIANPKVYANPDKIKYYTNIIRQENKRMNVQVENVLQIAQLEKNEFAMNLQLIDLHALIAKAVESIQLQVEERMGQITAQLNALEHVLKLDEVHAYHVICNLLDNANKYSPGSPEIKLVTQNVDGGIILAVEDKGMGMTRDTQLRVFDKFYRVPTGNLHNVKGFGLGLSYVKAIVKAHHGNISLQSEPGKGSRFEIFLPFHA